MENTMTMPAATVAKGKAESTVEAKPAVPNEHWSVEFTGGMTLATTMVSALSLWYVFLAFVALPGVSA